MTGNRYIFCKKELSDAQDVFTCSGSDTWGTVVGCISGSRHFPLKFFVNISDFDLAVNF